MIDKINQDVVAIIKLPAVREKLGKQLIEPVGSRPEEFRARVDGEVGRWAPVDEDGEYREEISRTIFQRGEQSV